MLSKSDSKLNKSEVQKTKSGMNLFSILKDYIDSMLSEQQGRKALILDEETLSKSNQKALNDPSVSSDCVNGVLENADSSERSLLLWADNKHSNRKTNAP